MISTLILLRALPPFLKAWAQFTVSQSFKCFDGKAKFFVKFHCLVTLELQNCLLCAELCLKPLKLIIFSVVPAPGTV